MGIGRIIHGDCYDVLQAELCGDNDRVDLAYIDPPFNTGRDRQLHQGSYSDSRGGWYIGWLRERVELIRDILVDDGSIFLHLDFREVHYAKVMMDEIFGRNCFQNEIIWHYDYGGRSKKRWSPKHDNILWYTKHPKNYVYNYDAIDRIPYMSPGLVGPEKAARGKTPTDTWWCTIVPTNGKERTGYPTQKPLKILERIVRVHSRANGHVADYFAGSGTTGVAAVRHGRSYTLCDDNDDAIAVMQKRLPDAEIIHHG